VFDTSESERLASHDALGYDHYSLATLYRTNNGKFFLVLDSNRVAFINAIFGHSDYAKFVPVTDDEAYAWLHRFDEIEHIERLFPGRLKKA